MGNVTASPDVEDTTGEIFKMTYESMADYVDKNSHKLTDDQKKAFEILTRDSETGLKHRSFSISSDRGTSGDMGYLGEINGAPIKLNYDNDVITLDYRPMTPIIRNGRTVGHKSREKVTAKFQPVTPISEAVRGESQKLVGIHSTAKIAQYRNVLKDNELFNTVTDNLMKGSGTYTVGHGEGGDIVITSQGPEHAYNLAYKGNEIKVSSVEKGQPSVYKVYVIE